MQPLKITLKTMGLGEVKADLKSVAQAYAEVEKAATAAVEAGSRKRVAAIQAESKAKVAAIKEQAAAREEASSFKKSLGRGGGEGGGDGLGSILKNAGIAGAAMGAMSKAIDFVTSSLQAFGSFVVNDIVKPGWELQTRAQQVANNSQGALTSKGVEDRARAIGLANNMDPMKVIEAAGVYQDLTGEAKQGFEMTDLFAAMSKGRGDADPAQLAQLAASVHKDGMSTKQLQDIMVALAGQGEKGSITIGQMARLGGRLSAPAAQMGGDQFTKITTASALLQATRHGFGSVDETATGLANFMKSAVKMKSIDPKAFANVNGVETLLDPVKFFGNILRKTGGNAEKLKQYGLDADAMKFIQAGQGAYGEAFGTAKKEGKTDVQAADAGAQAWEDVVNSLKKSTSTMEAEGQKRDAVMATDGERWASTVNKFKAVISESALPAFEKLVDGLNPDDVKAAAEDLAMAIDMMVEGLMWLSGKLNSLKDFKEGEVVATVSKRTAERNHGMLPEQTDMFGSTMKGYYLQNEKGDYQFVKGAMNRQGLVEDTSGNAFGSKGQKVYKYDPNTPLGSVDSMGPQAATDTTGSAVGRMIDNPAAFLASKIVNEIMPDDSGPQAPEGGPGGGGGASSDFETSVEEVVGANDKLVSTTERVRTALDAVSRKAEDVASSMDQLNRTKSMYQTGGP